MRPVYIIAAKRSAIGRFGGGFKDTPPADLVAAVAKGMLTEDLLPKIEKVLLGQVLQAGGGMNVARQLALKLSLAQQVPGVTLNVACGSGMEAVRQAALEISTGAHDMILAGGVEVMSRAPHYVMDARWGKKLGNLALIDSLQVDGLSDPLLNLGMGETAERIVDKLHISREAQDAYALRSQRLAQECRGAMAREIVPVTTRAGVIDQDEHPRADVTLESLASLKPAFRKDGTVTAGNASGINDGAALLLLSSEVPAGCTALGRIVGSTLVGCDPAMMGLGPVPAIQALCRKTQWKLDEVDAIEINEAFAAQTLGCLKELDLGEDKVNQRGGGIALGHPIGASGARVLVTLLHLLEDTGGKRGIASLCIGGGMGIAMAVER